MEEEGVGVRKGKQEGGRGRKYGGPGMSEEGKRDPGFENGD